MKHLSKNYLLKMKACLSRYFLLSLFIGFFTAPYLINSVFALSKFSANDLISGEPTPVNLIDSKNLATLIVFLSAKCPCSSSHEIALKKLHANYAIKGIRFLAIHSNADEPLEFAREQFKQRKLPFAILKDNGTEIADELKALKTPHAYLFNSSGQLIFQGGVDDSNDTLSAKKHFLQDALQAATEGKLPTVKEARALGCRIKRKI